jgi:hypothetical protein
MFTSTPCAEFPLVWTGSFVNRKFWVVHGTIMETLALRRTFCTMQYLSGTSRDDLRQLMGHQKWKSTRGYIDVASSEQIEAESST